MISVEEDELAGLELSSDESCEAEPTDDEVAGQGNQMTRKPYRRRARSTINFFYYYVSKYIIGDDISGFKGAQLSNFFPFCCKITRSQYL